MQPSPATAPRRTFRSLARAFLLAGALGIAASGLSVLPAAAPSSASAAPCVRFSASNFDAYGNDNYRQYLNGEWVRIKNYCATSKSLGGWRIHDYQAKHTYRFASGVRIGAYSTITLYSGTGSNAATKRYWQRTYGAVWNNDPPEYAYLRNGSGTLISRWTEY